MKECLKHLLVPDLKHCQTCRANYKEVFDLWLGKQEIEEVGN